MRRLLPSLQAVAGTWPRLFAGSWDLVAKIIDKVAIIIIIVTYSPSLLILDAGPQGCL